MNTALSLSLTNIQTSHAKDQHPYEKDENWAWKEVQQANLSDVRCIKSVATICQRISQQPGLAFSRVTGNKRKAGHRIMKKESVTPYDLLIGHAKQTQKRIEDYLSVTQKYPFV
jgi:hypothetical protein